jgi:hypothetical protein
MNTQSRQQILRITKSSIADNRHKGVRFGMPVHEGFLVL